MIFLADSLLADRGLFVTTTKQLLSARKQKDFFFQIEKEYRHVWLHKITVSQWAYGFLKSWAEITILSKGSLKCIPLYLASAYSSFRTCLNGPYFRKPFLGPLLWKGTDSCCISTMCQGLGYGHPLYNPAGR